MFIILPQSVTYEAACCIAYLSPLVVLCCVLVVCGNVDCRASYCRQVVCKHKGYRDVRLESIHCLSSWTLLLGSGDNNKIGMAAIRSFGRDIPYLRQQFAALLGNTSTSVKFICIVVLLSYCLSFSENAVLVLSVTPGYLLPPAFWIWTAFTFCFLEIHFLEVCVDLITVGLCGKLIEPLWGPMEMMTFFAIVNFGVAVLSSTYYLVFYMCTGDTDVLFNMHIHGLTGYIAGLYK